MPTAPIPFAPQQSSGQEPLAGAMPISMNTYIDKAGAIRKRPGLRLLPGGPAGVLDTNGLSGIRRCLNGDIYAIGSAGAERPIYRVTGSTFAALGAGIAPAGLRGTGRPVFAETEMLLVVAGGDAIEKIELATAVSDRLSGPPPTSTHVITNSLRLLANDSVLDRTKIRYSDIAQGTTTYAGNEQWTPGASNDSGFFTAEARPDPVVALGENTNSIFAFGQSTLEIFGPDPTYRFTRVAAMENGCGAPYSITKSEQLMYWIDDLHRALKGSDQRVDVISEPVQRTLDGLTIDDAFGYRVYLGPVDCIVWTFPTNGVSLVYQQDVGWSQWSGWDGSRYTQLQANCLDGYTLVGTRDGHIAEYSLDAFDDLGQPIRAHVETGFQSRGSNSVKDCSRVTLALKRGQSSSSPTPSAQLKWRDRPGPWEEPIEIDLGQSDDTEIVVDLPSLGTYRYREWCFEFTGTDDLALVSATEEYEVTES